MRHICELNLPTALRKKEVCSNSCHVTSLPYFQDRLKKSTRLFNSLSCFMVGDTKIKQSTALSDIESLDGSFRNHSKA